VAEQPTGTVTLLFTDIEGSTALLRRLGTERYGQALDLHRRLLRDAFDRHGGYEVDCEGDAFFVAFSRAGDAVAAAADAQQALAQAEWPEDGAIRVRMGLHTGEPVAAPPKYVGLDVHKAARIMAAGHGGQVLVSAATERLVTSEVALLSLGEHRLKDLLQPEPLHQLAIPGLPSEFPALKTLGNRPTNLPVQPNPLIGREREVGEVTGLLREPTIRLLTLTGPGGSGKTRLALQVGAELLDEFPSGVFFVPLAPIRDPALVLPAISQILALREVPGEELAETLTAYLEQKQMLLVVDNLEQVVEAASDLVRLLAGCPKLKLVVTSRERLRVRGERVYAVLPLPLVDPAADLDALVANDAVALFAARAEAAAGGFAIDKANASAVAAICERLDGLPLAIELAAARVVSLPPQALLARIERSLPLLTGGARDLEERQQTLKATIDWSYDLLTEQEQQLFARLGVFVGGCRLEAAEAVCDGDANPGVQILDGITSLVEKSLLRQRDDPDGEPRFWMLETIREYAASVLAPTEAAAVEHRHLRYHVERAKAAWDERIADSPAWFEWCDNEIANFRAATTWAFAADRTDEALPLIVGWSQFLGIARGLLSEGRLICEEALRRSTQTESLWRYWTLAWAGEFARHLGDHSAAIPLKQEALRGFRKLENKRAIAATLADLGDMISLAGEIDSATALLEEALAIRTELGDPGGIAHAEAGLGGVNMLASDYETADALLRSALGRIPADSKLGAMIMHTLGESLRRQDRTSEATRYLLQSLTVANELGLEPVSAECLECLGAILVKNGDYSAAATLWGAAASFRERTGVAPWLPLPPATIEKARAESGHDAFQRAHDHGQAMPLDDVTAYARERFETVTAPISEL
jgi:predicted ATPase/class 3 adenylate cyclase